MSWKKTVAATALAVCAWTAPEALAEESGNYHHAHLNVVDPAATIDFYEKILMHLFLFFCKG